VQAFPSVNGHLVHPVRVPTATLALPLNRGTGSPCLLSSRFHHPGAYITTRSTSGKHLACLSIMTACYVDNVISPFVHRM
jgi:hypothetical protein